MKLVVIIGATSALAQAIAKLHATAGDHLLLVGRNEQRLDLIRQDLLVRGAGKCETHRLDLTATAQHEALWDDLYTHGKPDIVYIAHGVLPDQQQGQAAYSETLASLQTNALSVISLLTGLANRMERDRHGHIVVIGSVAGDRGRQSNYIYGTAKAMLATFLQGLRNRLFRSGVTVTTVKPGFIDTPMTAHFKKSALWATPEQVANDILRAVHKKRNVIYTPRIWFFIMTIIKAIPEFIFKRLSL